MVVRFRVEGEPVYPDICQECGRRWPEGYAPGTGREVVCPSGETDDFQRVQQFAIRHLIHPDRPVAGQREHLPAGTEGQTMRRRNSLPRRDFACRGKGSVPVELIAQEMPSTRRLIFLTKKYRFIE